MLDKPNTAMAEVWNYSLSSHNKSTFTLTVHLIAQDCVLTSTNPSSTAGSTASRETTSDLHRSLYPRHTTICHYIIGLNTPTFTERVGNA